MKTGIAYAVKCSQGFFAEQGGEYWFEDSPVGWALFCTEEGARNALERNHSALGTAPALGGEIVAVDYP